MKKFRIKEVSYNNGETKYFIQKRYFGIIWIKYSKDYVYLSQDSKSYIAELLKSKPIIEDSINKMKKIKDWLELDEYNHIGYNEDNEIIFIHPIKDKNQLKFIGSNHKKVAEIKRENYIDDNKKTKITKIKEVIYHF